MQITFGCFNVEMAKQVFYKFDVCSFIQQMGGEAVAQAVNTYFLSDAGLAFCISALAQVS
jgi:hypothetical protein